jgi:hypothetical protein
VGDVIRPRQFDRAKPRSREETRHIRFEARPGVVVMFVREVATGDVTEHWIGAREFRSLYGDGIAAADTAEELARAGFPPHERDT